MTPPPRRRAVVFDLWDTLVEWPLEEAAVLRAEIAALVEIAQHVRERLAALRRRRGKLRRQVSRLHLREHRELADALEVARGPVDGRVAVIPEGHGRFRRSFCTCAHVCVLSTSSFVSHPRRAWATPSAT